MTRLSQIDKKKKTSGEETPSGPLPLRLSELWRVGGWGREKEKWK
jgi:hypothetical protein